MTPLAGSWYPRAVHELHWTEMDGAYLLSSPGDGRIHALNNVGAILLELANGAYSEDEMVQVLQQAFGLSYAPETEVREFLERAVEAGLVE